MKQDRTSPVEIERLLFHMPTCARQATDAWAAQFARDMARRRHWRNWQPSAKQIDVMRRMVSDLFAHGREEIEVLE